MKYNISNWMFYSCFLMMCTGAQAETEACRANAGGIVAEMRSSGDYPDMTDREIRIARQAAIAACDTTFSNLEAELQEAKNSPQTSEGIDPENDPIGWLKEQWNKEPVRKKGLERLKNRAGR